MYNMGHVCAIYNIKYGTRLCHIWKYGTRLYHIWKCHCIQPLTKHAHIVPTLLFSRIFLRRLIILPGGMKIVIDSIWRRCITEQGFVFHYFRTKSRRLEHSHHLNI